jgi:hypothetical protein
MFACIEPEQPPAIAMNDRASRQHLRIKPGTPGHQAMEDAAMPVGPIHHRGNGKSSIQIIHLIDLTLSIDPVKDWTDWRIHHQPTSLSWLSAILYAQIGNNFVAPGFSHT